MNIKFDIKVKGLDSLEKKVNSIVKRLPQTVTESIEEVLKNIRGYAIRLERGHNEKGILVEMIDTNTMEIKGRVYAKPDEFVSNGQSYLWFEYFGTGRICRKRACWKNDTF